MTPTRFFYAQIVVVSLRGGVKTRRRGTKNDARIEPPKAVKSAALRRIEPKGEIDAGPPKNQDATNKRLFIDLAISRNP